MPSVILLPTAIGNHSDEWTQSGGASKPDAVDPGDPISHDDLTSLLFTALPGRRQSMKFEALSTKVPSAKTVVAVFFALRVQTVDAQPINEIFFRSADATQFNSTRQGRLVLGPNSGWVDYGEFLPPADNGDWTVAKADLIQMQWLLNGPAGEDGVAHCTSVWVVAEYGETITAVEPPDEVARRRLRRYRFPDEPYRLELGPRAEQIQPWEDFHFAEPFGPDALGQGFGPEEWSSRFLRARRKTINQETGIITLDAVDPTRYLTMFFLSEISDAPGKTIGTIRLDQGIEESFTRASKAWVEWKDGLVYEIQAGEQKHSHLGYLCERGRTNRLLNSAFHVDGGGGGDTFASWVETDGITAETSDPYFADVAVSKQHCKITNTSPVEDRGVNQTTGTSFAGSTWFTLTVTHREDVAGEQCTILVQNPTTGNFLQSDGSWAASPDRFSPWPNRPVRTRESIVFQMESTGSTLLYGARSKLANGVVRLWQIDLIDNVKFQTSPIVTYASEVTENTDERKFKNFLNQEAIPFVEGDQFTVQTIIRPLFSSTESDGDHWLYAVRNNGAAIYFALLYFEGIGFAFNLTLTSDPPGPQAPINVPFNALDEIKIVHRRSSGRGEFDLGANVDHLMIQNPATGEWMESAQVSAKVLTNTADKDLYLGYEDFLSALGRIMDSHLVYMDSRPFVLNKEEAKDFP